MTRANFVRGAAAAGAVAALGPLPAAVRAAPTAGPAAAKPVVSAFIRGLLGMDMPTLAAFLDDAGIDGAEVPVRANLSYIRPDQAAEQLPRLADALARRGKRIYCVTTDIVSADSPHAEAIVKTVARLGIPRYRLGFLRYDLEAPSIRSATRCAGRSGRSPSSTGPMACSASTRTIRAPNMSPLPCGTITS